MTNEFDVVIVGAGPAGLAAGLYAARDRYRTCLLDKFMPGGQILVSERIENYPGWEFISGPDLITHMVKQVEQFGASLVNSAEVTALKRRDDGQIELEVNGSDKTYSARVVILAPGSGYRNLGVPGEEKFTGSGVSYCGTCDAPFFRDKHVVSVGGGNSAIEETLHLGKFCSKVTMLHRRDEFRATRILVDELYKKKDDHHIELRLSHVLEAIEGDQKVQRALLKNLKTGESFVLDCEGVFIFAGMVPGTKFLEGFVELGAGGFISCDPATLRTKVPGVFVAGDCRVGAPMQLVTACADGVTCALMMKHYLRDPAWWNA